MAGYPRDVVRYFVERFGTDHPLRKALEEARATPGFSEEIARVDIALDWLSGQMHQPPGKQEELEAEQRALVMEALEVPAALRSTEVALAEKQNGDDKQRGVELPTDLVERAVQLHVHEGLGRSKLQFHPDLKALGEWGARSVLHATKAGKPFGLWLDDDDRLCWGTRSRRYGGPEQRLEQEHEQMLQLLLSCACRAPESRITVRFRLAV